MIDPEQFGVSFSLKQCRSFDIDPKETLRWLIKVGGFRRFRLMSYWNEHEKSPSSYDFSQLDWQIDMVKKTGGQITLCLGARQPRWPENHWPDWAWNASFDERSQALLNYIARVVARYKNESCIVSYQLENEAILVDFGRRSEVDRDRLKAEVALIRRLDSSRPIIMTTSTSWGIPIRQPIPGEVGFSFYHIVYRKGAYHHSLFYPWIHRLRKGLIRILHNRHSFIHELQLEPWGPTAIWKMPIKEQDKSMSPGQINTNIKLARKIKAYPIDLWGGEWWYWRFKNGDPTIWKAVHAALTNSV